jgi:hypothetical protein
MLEREQVGHGEPTLEIQDANRLLRDLGDVCIVDLPCYLY